MGVTRYAGNPHAWTNDGEPIYGSMSKDDDGGWVRWEDHEAAITKTAEVVSRATADAIHEAYCQVSIKALEDAIK